MKKMGLAKTIFLPQKIGFFRNVNGTMTKQIKSLFVKIKNAVYFI